jgi:hypothetical protein
MARKKSRIPAKYEVKHKVAVNCRTPDPPKGKERVCLACDKPFLSYGLRLCPKCQSLRESRTAVATIHRFHGSELDFVDSE